MTELQEARGMRAGGEPRISCGDSEPQGGRGQAHTGSGVRGQQLGWGSGPYFQVLGRQRLEDLKF